MLSFLRRSAQTRTTIHDASTEDRKRIQSVRIAYRVMVCVQIITQLLLWVVFWLYADISRTSWEAMALQLLPALATWMIWSAIPRRTPSLLSLRLRLLLLPCALIDCCVLLSALSLFCQLQLSSWPSPAVSLGLTIFVFFAVSFGGKHGVAFGINQIRTLILLLFCGILLLRLEPDANNLWPFFGEGPGVMMRAALAGAGGVWGIALLFALPRDATPALPQEKRSSTLAWALLPVVMVCLWTFWLCLCGNWQSDNPLLPKEKMIVLAWRGSDLLMFQLATVSWLLMFIASVVGNTASAVHLLDEAIPRCPRRLVTGLYLLLPLAFTFFPEKQALDVLQLLLPYRMVLALGTGLVTLVVERKRPA